MGKLKRLLSASWPFFAAIALAMGAVVAWRMVGTVPREAQAGVGLAAILILAGAGWKLSRVDRFGLLDIGLVGAFLSLATAWSLPIFHNSRTIVIFGAINAAMYGICAIIGGVMEKLYRKFSSG